MVNHHTAPEAGRLIPFFSRLHFRMAAGVILTLLLITASLAYIIYSLHKRQLFEALKNTSTSVSLLVQQGLENAMLLNNSVLLQGMVEEIGNKEGVKDIVILNKKGLVAFSSNPGRLNQVLSLSDPTCRICHRVAPNQRAQTVLLTTPGGAQFFRSVSPIQNKPACYSCHNPGSRLNGVLVMDFSMAAVNKELAATVKKIAWITGLMTLLMLAVIGLLMNKLVLRRVAQFSRVTRLVGEGKLDQRVVVRGGDELAQLAFHFNRMMEKLAASLEQVSGHKEYLERLISSLDEGLLVIDEELRVVSVNTAFVTNFACPAGEVGGYRCHEMLLHPLVSCQEASTCPARQVFSTGQLQRVLHNFYDSKGRERYVEIYATPLRNTRGEIFQVAEVWRDITERKTLEASLAHSERLAAVGLLASGFSHEINTPLASISASIEGLKRRAKSWAGPPEMEEYLDLIYRETLRCKEITDKLLLLSRESQFRPGPIQANKALSEAVSLLRPEAMTKGIQIKENLDPQLPLILADESQMKQVLINIVLNAIQAMERGGRLTVSTSQDPERIFIAVEDTGCGIPPEDLNRIFDPFFTKKGVGQGTGLGLFISHSLVRDHGGEIKVESQPGQGSKFTVILPLTVARQQ